MTSIQPRVIRRSDPTRIEIEWSNGETTVWPTAELRRQCPCAQCVDELTGVRRLDPARVQDDLVHQDVQMVGNYAIALRFSDGHHTGIYSFAMLRERAPEPREHPGGHAP